MQRVPVTEAQGRIHTSAATVAILPELAEVEQIEINPGDLRVDTYRASGAGGQHVNKTDSAIRITHLPSGIVVECQDERSQHKNRSRAMSLLQAKLLAAEREKQTSAQAQTRKLLVGSGDRSERIRTYNFPQGRVTDHRINLTLYKLGDILAGNLDPDYRTADSGISGRPVGGAGRVSVASLRELLADAARRLAEISETPRLDAEVLLAAALDRPRSYLHAWPERTPEPEPTARFAAWLERRRAGEPVAYLLGRREFWSLELEVTPDTLIPRPETELLVELALEQLSTDRSVTVADLGTGSGAIALALAVERPLARIVATDQSAAALTVARRNAQRLKIRNVEFREGDWCAPLGDERFDLIAANPPYVAATDPRWRVR